MRRGRRSDDNDGAPPTGTLSISPWRLTMKNVNATLASFVVMTAMAVPALAMQSPSPQPAPAPTEQSPTQVEQQPKLDTRTVMADEKSTAKGRLVRVDTDAMTIVIKGADDEEQQFRYTDNTKVIGVQEQVSGLSTKAGSLVTVHFMPGAGDARIATKVHFADEKK
jgi:hypothetical protein